MDQKLQKQPRTDGPPDQRERQFEQLRNRAETRVVLEAGARQSGVDKEAFQQGMFAKIGARRPGDPDEFGAACAFLCSRQAAYITAQNVLIDGGLYPGTF